MVGVPLEALVVRDHMLDDLGMLLEAHLFMLLLNRRLLGTRRSYDAYRRADLRGDSNHRILRPTYGGTRAMVALPEVAPGICHS